MALSLRFLLYVEHHTAPGFDFTKSQHSVFISRGYILTDAKNFKLERAVQKGKTLKVSELGQ